MGRTITHRNRTTRMLGGLAAAAVLGVTACSGGGGDDDAATEATAAPAEVAPAATEAAADAASGDAELGVVTGAPAGAGGAISSRQVAPQLAIEAHATMQTDDVRGAVERITTAVATRGGRVASADIDYASPASADDEPDSSRATLVVAIPPAELGDVRGVLDEVGDVLSYDQLAEDVAEQLADLDTRIANQRASIARIRELYAAAVDVDAVVRIEAELTNRETVLEQLLAAQQSLSDRVAMSTLTIDIASTPEAIEAAEDDDPGLGDALAGGWSAFAGGVFAIVLALTAAMPFLLTALAIALVALGVRTRTVRKALSPRRSESDPLRSDVPEPLRSDVLRSDVPEPQRDDLASRQG